MIHRRRSSKGDNIENNSGILLEGTSFANISIGEEDPDDWDNQVLTKTSNHSSKSPKDSADRRFTPLRWWINAANLLLMLCSLAEIVFSAIVIASSFGYFISGIYTGSVGFVSSLYPTNHLKYLPVEWVVRLSFVTFILGVISSAIQNSNLTFVNSLTACVVDDLSAYYGAKQYYTAAFNCKSNYKTDNYACFCVSSTASSCYPLSVSDATCGNFINSLPQQIFNSFILSILTTNVSGLLFLFSLLAWAYPSLLSIVLLRQFLLEVTPCDFKEVPDTFNFDFKSQRYSSSDKPVPFLDTSVEMLDSIQSSAVMSPNSLESQPEVPVETNRYRGSVSKKGLKHGKGSFFYANGDSYEGDWVSNKKHGMGYYKYANGDQYMGEFWQAKKNGRGVYQFFSGDIYEGEYRNGLMDGTGNYQYADGSYYIGDFSQGMRHGTGKHTYVSGASYTGDWKQDVAHGKGKYIYPDGQIFDGEFNEGKMVTPR